LLLLPEQNVVICLLSVSLEERPLFFCNLWEAIINLRNDDGHTHWIIADEAHHLLPQGIATASFNGANNFILTSSAPDKISLNILSEIGMIITVGDNPSYPFEQFAKVLEVDAPEKMSVLQKSQCCVWHIEKNQSSYVVEINKPTPSVSRKM